MRYREPTKTDWRKSITYLVAYIVAISIGAFLLIPMGGIGILLWAVIVLGGLLLLVWWHARSVAFRCTNCNHEFEISTLTDFMSPHGMDWYYLKCPHCGQRTRAKVLVKDGDN